MAKTSAARRRSASLHQASSPSASKAASLGQAGSPQRSSHCHQPQLCRSCKTQNVADKGLFRVSVLSQMALWPRLVVLGNTLPVLQPAEHPPCSKQPEDAHRAEAVAIKHHHSAWQQDGKLQECKLGNCCLSVNTLPVTWWVLQHTKACQRCCQVSQWKLHAQQGLDSARLQPQTELLAAQPDLLEVRCVSSCWQPRASRPAAPAHGTAASPCFCSLVMLPGGAAWAELGTTARGKMQGSTLWDEAHIRQLHFTGHLQHAHVAKWGSQPPWHPHGLNTSSPYAVVPVPCKMAPTSSQLSAAD